MTQKTAIYLIEITENKIVCCHLNKETIGQQPKLN